MRLSLFGLLLATSCLSTAYADDLKATSQVDAVTVYPSGAEVTRIAKFHIPAGETTLLLEDLPADIEGQSIRVEGTGAKGLEIGSVDSKSLSLSSEQMDQQRKKLEDQIKELNDQKEALNLSLADNAAQKKFLLGLANKQFSSGESDKSVSDVGQITAAYDIVGAKLPDLSKAAHELQIQIRQLDEQIADVQTHITNLAPNQVTQSQVAIHLAAQSEMDVALSVKYRVRNAGWVPFYDARLAIGSKGKDSDIEIVRRAEVIQSTGESWNDVGLTLSTAFISRETQARELEEQEVEVAEADENRGDGVRRDVGAGLQAAAPTSKAEQDAEKKRQAVAAVQSQAYMQRAGFQTVYQVPGRTTVDNSGMAKKLRISTDKAQSKISVLISPDNQQVAQKAYITAFFPVSAQAPFMAGKVNLYRDGVYLGQGELPELSGEKQGKLGFGADDMIAVSRHEVKRAKGEEGTLTSYNKEEVSWQTTIKNMHDFAMPVLLLDQMPFSSNDKAQVALLPDTTDPTIKDYDKKRGVMGWQFDLKPDESKQINFGYKVMWSKGQDVYFPDQQR